jgi:hypothetical protein
MLEWSEKEFQARVTARLKQLGTTETAALRAVGGTGDEIRKTAKRGRRIDTILLIAHALKWTLGQALGLQDPTAFYDRDLAVDPRKLARAWAIAEEAIGDNPEGQKVEVLAEASSLIYSVLSEREASGESLDDVGARSAVASLLRRFFAK